MPQNEEFSLFQSIGFLATGLREYLSREFDMRLKPFGIVHKQAGILWRIISTPLSQVALCDMVQADKNYIRMYIDDLEEKGLVMRVQNPKNRRENLIHPTESGRALAAQTYTIMQETHTDLLSPHLSEEEIKLLQKLLYRAFVGLRGGLEP